MTLSLNIIANNNANWGFDAFSFGPALSTIPTPSLGSTGANQRASSEKAWTTTTATTTPPTLFTRGLAAEQQSIADLNVAANASEENISPMKNDALCVTIQASDPAARAYDSNLYVASLPDWFTDADLYELFKRFGPILSAKVMRHKGTHQCKGYGFVLFRRTDDAAVARSEMIGHVVGGNRIQVRRARSAASAPLGDCTSSVAVTAGVGALQSPLNTGSPNVSSHFMLPPSQPIQSLYSTTPTYGVANNGGSPSHSAAHTMLVAISNSHGVVQSGDNIVYMVLAPPQVSASNFIF